MDDNEFGNISVSENEDGIAVWEFTGQVTSDIPLDTEAQDFANAINELSKKLQQGGGGDEPTDDWQPSYLSDPVWEMFKNAPKPGAYQIVIGLLVVDPDYTPITSPSNYVYNETSKSYEGEGELKSSVQFMVGAPSGTDIAPAYHIDWGDGTVSQHADATQDDYVTYAGNGGYNGIGGTSLYHTYSKPGYYTIVFTTSSAVLNFNNPGYGWTFCSERGVYPSAYQSQTFNELQARVVFLKVGSGFVTGKLNAEYLGDEHAYYLGKIAASESYRYCEFPVPQSTNISGPNRGYIWQQYSPSQKDT